MIEFSLWKQLKKKLRRNRGPVWQLGCYIVAVIGLLMFISPGSVHAQPLRNNEVVDSFLKPGEEVRSVIQMLDEHKGLITVKLHRLYLCGDEITSLGQMNARDVLQLLRDHSEWTAIQDQSGTVVLEQRIDDMSNACKQNAFIGMDKHGNLSLFEGSPKKEKVLRTFFQLDVRYMESSLPKDQLDNLINGIRITDKDAYNSVLSTFSDFAVEKSQKVMKPTY
ncbi:hypothetical protein Back11_06190 [Paenibacillus baekrokdamisoli]|uniref:Uncharacterized protein n=1 Tax=Paenibacillus baekrokdamisoli TaxID=1712516 RepID=A0A3G9J7H4_9BACL|nr:BofC C-terminal domain-containing protein [Paenibacillus baekrokdamisoli]MBB3067541.1 forespore regulator of the sigma-K checkpoint [Paenibacillus baekrokdamisoli]BBH19274.1 hypothetical protein Back11_06190 [Paenibacillus baekrokdamisoli]